MSDQFHRARRLATVSGFALVLGAGLVAAPQAALAQTRSAQAVHQLDIPAGPLESSLIRLAEISGVQLVYSSQVTADRRGPALAGRMDAATAFGRLLVGSGLTYRFVDERTVTIERSLPQVEADGSRLLGPVMVEGATGVRPLAGATPVNGVNGSRDVTATEGTGSYTSNAITIGSKAPRSLDDVPQSISVVTAQFLEDQNVSDFTQALRYAPGVTVTQEGTSLESSFYSRGFQINAIQIDGGAPLATGLFADGASRYPYFPQIDFAQYDHVEVLRGASGALSGYGSPSGSVNLVRKKPLDQQQLKIELRAGSWDTYRAVLDATGPLTGDGRLRGRAVFSYQDNAYFYDVASDNKTLIYGILDYDLTDVTLLEIGASYTRQDSVPWRNGLPRFQNGDDLELPRETCLCFGWNSWDFDTTEIFANVEHELATGWTARLGATFNSQDSTRKIGSSQAQTGINPLTGAGARLVGTYSDYSSEQLSLELTLNGEFKLFGMPSELTIGANRVESAGDGELLYGPLVVGTLAEPYRPYPGGPAYYSGSVNGATPPIFVFNFNPSDPLYTEPRNPLATNRNLVNRQIQTGVYALWRLSPTPRLHIDASLRYGRYQRDLEQETLCTVIPTAGVPAANNCVGKRIGDRFAFAESHYEGDDLTFPPSVSVSYELGRGLTAYAGYTDIYVSQANQVDRDLKASDPVTGSNIEGGIKWAGLGGLLNASLAIYRIEQEGFAVVDESSYPVNPDGSLDTSVSIDNAGNRYNFGEVTPGVRCCYLTNADISLLSTGIDAEVTGQIRQGWQVAGSYTYNDNEYRGADLALLYGDVNGLTFASRQPKHLFKLWTRYEFPDGGLTEGLALNAGIFAQSSAFQSGSACAQLGPPNALGVSSCVPGQTIPFSFTQPGYAVVSIGGDYRLGDRWTVGVDVNNLLDKTYYRTMGSTSGGNWYGEPRSVTVSLRATW